MTDQQIIVTKLITGSVKAVVPFGSATPGNTYAVVKMERTGLGYTRVRVIVHMAVGQTVALEDYCRKTVFDLLAYVLLTGSGGRTFALSPLGLGNVSNQNSDGTISQEALFKLPVIEYV